MVIFKKLDALKNPKQFKSWVISIFNRKAIGMLAGIEIQVSSLSGKMFE
jgi:hypothetical protein